MPPDQSAIVIDRFTLVERLRGGPNGQVWIASDETSRKVAVKILPAIHQGDPEWEKRFQCEADNLRGVSGSKYIVGVLGAGIHPIQGPWLAMEYLPHSLGERISEKHGDPARVRQLLTEIARALVVLHSHESTMLHLDVKPSNILEDDKGQFKLADFGCARPQALDPTITSISLKYASPELQGATGPNGLWKAGPWTDLYSLGFCAYELALGGSEFRKQFPTIFGNDTFGKSVHEARERAGWVAWHSDVETTVPPPHSVIDFPENVSKIIGQLIEKDPRKRFQSADDLLVALGSADMVTPVPVALTAPPQMSMRRILIAAGLAFLVGGAAGFGTHRWLNPPMNIPDEMRSLQEQLKEANSAIANLNHLLTDARNTANSVKQKLDAEIAARKVDKDKLEQTIAQLKDAQKAKDSLTTRSSKLESDLAEANASFSAAQARATMLNTQLTTRTEERDNTIAKLTLANDDLNKLKDSYEDLGKKSADLKQQYKDLSDKYDVAIKNAPGNFAQLKQDLEAAKKAATDAGSERDGIKSSLDAAKTRLAALEPQIAGLNQQVTNLQIEKTQLTNATQAAKAKADELQQSSTNLKTSNTTLETQVADLKEQLRTLNDPKKVDAVDFYKNYLKPLHNVRIEFIPIENAAFLNQTGWTNQDLGKACANFVANNKEGLKVVADADDVVMVKTVVSPTNGDSYAVGVQVLFASTVRNEKGDKKSLAFVWQFSGAIGGTTAGLKEDLPKYLAQILDNFIKEVHNAR